MEDKREEEGKKKRKGKERKKGRRVRNGKEKVLKGEEQVRKKGRDGKKK